MLIQKNAFPLVAYERMNVVHLEEIDLLNEIADMVHHNLQSPDFKATLDDRLNTFQQHIKNHFAGEETAMQQSQFPAYPIHKKEHDRLLAELDELYATWRQQGDVSPLLHHMLAVMPEWLVQHVSTLDMVTADFLVRNA